MNAASSSRIPSLTLTPVFEAARLGYDQTRIPAIVRTSQGTLIAFCEGRRGPGGDWSRIDILMRRSTDAGKSWLDVEVLLKSDGGPVSNATPIANRNGVVHLLFQRDYSRCFVTESRNEGATWDSPRDLTPVFEAFRADYNWKVLAPGPGHGIQLSGGRLIVPVWLSAPAESMTSGGDHRPSCVATIVSDDGGATWKRGDIVVGTSPDFLNPSETVAVELTDGRVMLNIRNESPGHRRLVSISPDGERNWSQPVFDERLFEPVCMASLVSATSARDGERILLFCNPAGNPRSDDPNTLPFCSRENGVIRVSCDDGKNWERQRVIDAGPFGYSDMAVSPDGTVFCLYDSGVWGSPPHHLPTHVELAKFDVAWIEADPLSGGPKKPE